MALRKRKTESIQVEFDYTDIKKLFGVPEDYTIEDYNIDCDNQKGYVIFGREYVIRPGRPRNGRKL